jgi:hypothetical protein
MDGLVTKETSFRKGSFFRDFIQFQIPIGTMHAHHDKGRTVFFVRVVAGRTGKTLKAHWKERFFMTNSTTWILHGVSFWKKNNFIHYNVGDRRCPVNSVKKNNIIFIYRDDDPTQYIERRGKKHNDDYHHGASSVYE